MILPLSAVNPRMEIHTWILAAALEHHHLLALRRVDLHLAHTYVWDVQLPNQLDSESLGSISHVQSFAGGRSNQQ